MGRVMSFKGEKKMKRAIIAISVVIGTIAAIWLGSSFLTLLFNYKLHHALGFGSVYLKNISVHVVAQYATTLIMAILFPLSLLPLRRIEPHYIYRAVWLVSIVIGWLVGLGLGDINAT